MRSRRLILLLTLVFSTADLLADFAVTNLKIATDAVGRSHDSGRSVINDT